MHLEALVLGDLLAWRDSRLDAPQVSCWRTAAGAEVDLVLEWQGRLLPIEVKASTHPSPADARHLCTFLDEYAPEAAAGLLLHCGPAIEWVVPRVLAVPWWLVM